MKRKRLWLAAVGFLGALILGLGLSTSPGQFSNAPVLERPVQAQQASPTRAPTPDAAAPSAEADASPSPSADEDSAEPTENQPAAEPAFATYQDPAGRFEIGILDGYKVSLVNGVLAIESPDGNLAYTVTTQQRATSQALNDNALAQIAIETFQRGEGFQAGAMEPSIPDGIQLPWTGSLTLGRKSQPMSGKILARQSGNQVLMLLISATENAAGPIEDADARKQAITKQVETAMSELMDSFKPL